MTGAELQGVFDKCRDTGERQVIYDDCSTIILDYALRIDGHNAVCHYDHEIRAWVIEPRKAEGQPACVIG